MVNQKRNTWKGFLALLGSMLLHAFSGVVVVGLAAAFGNVAQVSFRAFAAFILTLIWLLITGFRYKTANHYDTKWLLVDIVCRPIFNICFVYAVLDIGPTAALFYLFASKLISGAMIKVLFGNKGEKPVWPVDYLCYLVVLSGLFVFTFPINHALELGVLFAMTSGFFEAVKSEAMGKIKVKPVDKPVVALYEFVSMAIITTSVVLISGQHFVVAAVTPYVWLVLGMSAMIAVGGLTLELTGFAEFDQDLGNAVLASEMGVASILNYFVLGTGMSLTQIIGSMMLVASLAMIAVAAYRRKVTK